MKIKTYIVDAFTDQPFKGNPAGVCIIENDINIPSDIEQLISLEKLNLNSEIFRTRCFILVCTKVLNKENPLYDDESKWFRKWEQQRIYKIREQAIKRIRILENLVGTGSNPAWMILTVFVPFDCLIR